MSLSRVGKKFLGAVGLSAILIAAMPVAAFAAITIDGVGSVSIDVSENQVVVDTVPAGSTIVAGGDDTDLFEIVSNVLRFKVARNFEAPADFGSDNTYSVMVNDPAGGPASTDAEELVFVRVLNVNEAPVFSSTNTASIAENTTTVMTVAAADPDAGAAAVTYSIVPGDDSAFFAIDGTSGALTITARDFETRADADTNNTYVVTVRASSGLTTDQTITVTITNENDVIPAITSDGGGDTAAISVPENTTAVTTVTSVDADNLAATYSITGGADAAFFSIVGNTGVLTITARDHETDADADSNGTYVVIVQVSDGTYTDTQTITVTIDNVAEVPAFTSGDATVSENTLAVTTVTATDSDGEALTFTITGGADQSKFNITAGGVLTFTQQRDYENPVDVDNNNVYVVEVTVTDASSAATALTINVTVTDLTEAPTGLTITAAPGGFQVQVTAPATTETIQFYTFEVEIGGVWYSQISAFPRITYL